MIPRGSQEHSSESRQSILGVRWRIRECLNARAIPDYRSVPGNISVYILERPDGPVTHFMTLTFWDSMAAIRGFAGDDVEVAKYYLEDRDFLLEYEPNVVHYEVVGNVESLNIP